MKTYQLYIDGAYVDPEKGEWFDSIDPYKGEPWAKVPRCGPEDVSRAVQAASRAMWKGPWAEMSPSARGKIMRRVGDVVAENATRLAEIEVRDETMASSSPRCSGGE